MFKFDVQNVLHSQDTAKMSPSSQADCYTLVKVAPSLKQSFFQMIDVTDPAVLHSSRSCRRSQVTARELAEAIHQFFLGNSAIIFLTLYH